MNTSNDGYLKVLKHQDFNTHIEQDSKSLELALNKSKKMEEGIDKSREKSKSDVLKRTLLLIGAGNL